MKDAVTNTKDPEVEKQNRRTTHVVSKPVFVRTRAPCEPPRPIVTGELDFLHPLNPPMAQVRDIFATWFAEFLNHLILPLLHFFAGYTTNTIQLYWGKPLLCSVVGKDDQGNPKYLKLSLEGYRLEINGKPHMRLVSSAQSCTLVKCKPGKTYRVVLVALTCTDEVRKDRKRRVS